MCFALRSGMMGIQTDHRRKVLNTTGAGMNDIVLGLTFSICAVAWLVLLVATGFSLVVVSSGLMAVMFVTGSSPRDSHHPISHGTISTRR
jgi:hypothetical protein